MGLKTHSGPINYATTVGAKQLDDGMGSTRVRQLYPHQYATEWAILDQVPNRFGRPSVSDSPARRGGSPHNYRKPDIEWLS